jgi:hypothetical protein
MRTVEQTWVPVKALRRPNAGNLPKERVSSALLQQGV